MLLCRMKFYKGALAVVALGWLTSTATPSVQAQTKRPFTLVSLAELSRLFSPQLSPDGKTLAYFASTTDWKSNRLVVHLWRQPTAGGPARQLTFTDGGDQPVVRWS